MIAIACALLVVCFFFRAIRWIALAACLGAVLFVSPVAFVALIALVGAAFFFNKPR